MWGKILSFFTSYDLFPCKFYSLTTFLSYVFCAIQVLIPITLASVPDTIYDQSPVKMNIQKQHSTDQKAKLAIHTDHNSK